MIRRRATFIAWILFVAVIHLASRASAASTERLSGNDRYETAAAVAQRVKAENRAGSTVLLTTGENFPDAVTAGGWPGDAVIVLTRSTSLPTASRNIINQAWVTKVYAIGGTTAISEALLTEIRGLGKTVERISGSNRYATSVAVSTASVSATSVRDLWVASGTSFADQLIAAAGARRTGGAFMLVAPSTALSTDQIREIDRIKSSSGLTLHVVDGQSALGSVRVSGATKRTYTGDAYTMSNASQAASSDVVVASGENWPDALGGTRLVTSSRPLILTGRTCAPGAVASRLRAASSTLVLGGTAALSTDSARGAACSSSTSTTTTAPSSTTTVTGNPLSGLTIAPEQPAGYDRDLFKHWIDADRDGCDTRREVLIAESVTPVTVGSGCSLTGGKWFSPYDGVETTDASTFDIDHVVALKEAWDSGANTWTADRRQAFANDLDNAFSLIAVSASSNRSKGEQDPAEWLPSRTAYKCTYVNDWIRVKKAWNLAVDQAEYNALQRVLATC
jgi:hypothetical protein